MTRLPKFVIPLLLVVTGAQAAVAVGAVSTGAVGDEAPISAKVKVLRTQADRKAGGGAAFTPARSGDRIRAGGSLRTDATGKAQLDYPDGSLTRLAGNTTFVVRELAEPPVGGLIRVRLDVGRTWSRVVKATATDGTYEIETPVATAAVRGTGFVVECTPEPACTFTVVEGTVDIRLRSGEILRLEAGQRLVVRPDGSAGPVENPGVDALRADPSIAENLALDAQQGFELALAATTTTTVPATTTAAPTTTTAVPPTTPPAAAPAPGGAAPAPGGAAPAPGGTNTSPGGTGPTLAINPTSGPAGTNVTFSVTGCADTNTHSASADGTIWIYEKGADPGSSRVVIRQVNSDGTWTGSGRITTATTAAGPDAPVQPGVYTYELTCDPRNTPQIDDASAFRDFTVTAS